MSFWDTAKRVGTAVGTFGFSEAPGLLNKLTTSPDADIESQRKRLLQQQAAAAGGFADQAQGNYQALGQQGYGALAGLQAQAQGQNSVSALQLRQGLQQNLAAQQSMAAGAAPQNAAMAARTAAIQSARLGAGLAGQQAVAGLQERNQAQQQYAGLLQGLRGQDAQAALGGRQAAIGGYGAANAGTPAPSPLQQYGPLIQSGAQMAAMSDRRLKTDIRDGGLNANLAISGLGASTYRYKDPRFGAGPQLGVMAQDLERAGLGGTVIDTPAGKAVDGAKLAGANTAMIAALGQRLAQVEAGPTPLGPRPSAPPRDLATLANDTLALDAQAALLRRRAMLNAMRPLSPRRTPWDYSADSADGGSYSADSGGQ